MKWLSKITWVVLLIVTMSVPTGIASADPEDVLVDIDKGINQCFESGYRYHTDPLTYQSTGWFHLYGEARIAPQDDTRPLKQWGLTFVRHDGDTTGAVDKALTPGKQYGSSVWFTSGKAGRTMQLRVWANGGPWCLEMTQLKVVPY